MVADLPVEAVEEAVAKEGLDSDLTPPLLRLFRHQYQRQRTRHRLCVTVVMLWVTFPAIAPITNATSVEVLDICADSALPLVLKSTDWLTR